MNIFQRQLSFGQEDCSFIAVLAEEIYVIEQGNARPQLVAVRQDTWKSGGVERYVAHHPSVSEANKGASQAVFVLFFLVFPELFNE